MALLLRANLFDRNIEHRQRSSHREDRRSGFASGGQWIGPGGPVQRVILTMEIHTMRTLLASLFCAMIAVSTIGCEPKKEEAKPAAPAATEAKPAEPAAAPAEAPKAEEHK